MTLQGRMALTSLVTLTVCLVTIQAKSVLKLDDVTAAVDEKFQYTIGDKIFLSKYRVHRIVDKKTKALPEWLVFDNTTNLLHGIPRIDDIGTYSIRLKAMCMDPSNMECQGKISRTFQIRVVEPIKSADSRGRTNFELHAWSGKHHGKYSLNLTNQAVTPQQSFMFMSSTNLYVHEVNDLHTAESVRPDSPLSAQHYLHVNTFFYEQSSSTDVNSFIKSPCDSPLPSIYASLLLHVKHELTNADLIDIVLSLSVFISKPLHLISLSNSVKDIFSMQMDNKHIITAGPGNVIGSLKESMELSWHLGCGDFSHLTEFAQVLQHNIDGGRIPRELNMDILAWYVYSDQPVTTRVRRNANARNGGTRTPTLSLEPSTVSFDISSLDIDFTDQLSTTEIPFTSSLVMNSLSSYVTSPNILSSDSPLSISVSFPVFTSFSISPTPVLSTRYTNVITTASDITSMQSLSTMLSSGILAFTSAVSSILVTLTPDLNSFDNTLGFSRSVFLSSTFSVSFYSSLSSVVPNSTEIEIFRSRSLSSSTEVFYRSSSFASPSLSTRLLVSSTSRSLDSTTSLSLSQTTYSFESFLAISSIAILSSETVLQNNTSFTSSFMSNVLNLTTLGTKSFNSPTSQSSIIVYTSFPGLSFSSSDDVSTVFRKSSEMLSSALLITSPVSDNSTSTSFTQRFFTGSLPSQSSTVAKSTPLDRLSSLSLFISQSLSSAIIVSPSTVRPTKQQSSYFIKPTSSYLFSTESSSTTDFKSDLSADSAINPLSSQSTDTIIEMTSAEEQSRNSLVTSRADPVKTFLSSYSTSMLIESIKTTVNGISTIVPSSVQVESNFFNASNTLMSSDSPIFISQTMLDTNIADFLSTSSLYITSYQTGLSIQKSPSVTSTTVLPTFQTTMPKLPVTPSTSNIFSSSLSISSTVLSSTSQASSSLAFSPTKLSVTSVITENPSNADFETRYSLSSSSTTVLKSLSVLASYTPTSTYSQLQLETSFIEPFTSFINTYSFASLDTSVKISDFMISSPMMLSTSESTEFQSSIYPSISTEIFSRQQLTTSSKVLMTSSHVVSTVAPDDPPVLQNSIDHLPIVFGKYFIYRIPANTFNDTEDGNTRNLTLKISLLYGKPIPIGVWLKFNSTSQTIYGIPLQQDFKDDEDKFIERFVLIAEDSQGQFARDVISLTYSFEVLDITHRISLTLDTDFQSFHLERQNLVDVAKSIAELYGNVNLKYLTFFDVKKGSVVISWGNNSLFGTICYKDIINSLYSTIADENGTLSTEFAELLKQFNPVSARLELSGPCLMPQRTPLPPFDTPIGASDNDQMWLEILLPALVVILVLVIIALVLLICCRHRKPSKEPQTDKPTFLEDRRPIIFPEELEMVDPSLKPKQPLILPRDYLAETPPAVPPHGSQDPPSYRVPEINEELFQPSTSQTPPPPSYSNQATSEPPPYRLPPPYYNPHRSNIRV